MISLQVIQMVKDGTITEAEAKNYSELQVLKSGAGYYIGTLYNEGNFIEPGSRDSTYFQRESDAIDALKILIQYKDDIPVWESWLKMRDLDHYKVGYRYFP